MRLKYYEIQVKVSLPLFMFNLFKKDKPAEPTPIPQQPTTLPSSIPEAPILDQATNNLSWAEKLKQGLSRTRNQLGGQLVGLFGGGKIDDDVYEELETILLTSDVGVAATQKLLDDIKNRVKRQSLSDNSQLREALKQALLELLTPLQKPLVTSTHKPFVIMLTGVNGAGKTTTIGKLANQFQAEGKSVLIAAGDTFRAAAREQLQVWGERNNVHVVTQDGGDPAAVIFDAVNSAKAKGIDIVMADTAGRLPTQLNLMEEIRKVQRVIDKALPGAPHEVLLVLDANTGQNAVMQVNAFDDALGVTGLVLSKLDGTAKGGVIAAIAQSRPIPIRYIGVGEDIADLRPFNASEFIEALFS
ncbi:hypothetical protein ZMTM_08130 [Methyloradius palustris]|uniref:Signal recognition particle receptor FtsY n=2 Tax=Methyloradius palustris TaxID=2778876 RepID=A0A8D5JVY3_9PROT|nr:hypothetical protein ZMTM_08130 [Methyloradius palustris]